jgi:hypothetical protein
MMMEPGGYEKTMLKIAAFIFGAMFFLQLVSLLRFCTQH